MTRPWLLARAVTLASLLFSGSLALAQPAKPAARPPAARAAAPAAPAAARPVAPPPAPTAGMPAVHTAYLDNGLEMAIAEVPGSPVVTVQVWYRAGAVDDPTGKHGLSHLFETLMFEGSARMRPGAHRDYIARVGGNTTASVNEDVSALADTVPVARLDKALALEAERMRGLELTDGAVAKAKAIATNQLRSQAASALWQAYSRLLATAFVQHPYGMNTGGVASEVDAITTADARAFYDAYYQPSNALVVVVGGVGVDAARAAIERSFAGMSRAAPPPRPAAELAEPVQSARRREEISLGGGLVMTGNHIPAATHADIYALQVLGQVLTAGATARLPSRLVKAKLAGEVGGQVLVRHDPGFLVVYASVAPGAKVAALEDALRGQIAEFVRTGPTAQELARAKKQIGVTLFGAAASVTGTGNLIGVSWSLTGKPAQFTADMTGIDAVSAADLRRVAARYLAADVTTVVVSRDQGDK
jgi:zinc protease